MRNRNRSWGGEGMASRSEGNLDALVGAFIAGFIGYQAGSRKFAHWEPIIKDYDTRMKHLAYFKILRPVTFLDSFVTAPTIYTEAILAFLFGLPNASIPTTLRCLEIGLDNKYIEDTGQLPPDRLYDLIEWAEKYLGNRKEIAHGFRILRNLVHSTTAVSEQNALEAIEHVTIILNLLYPNPIFRISIGTDYTCQNCGVGLRVNVPVFQNYLGNIYTANCYQCHQPAPLLVI